MAYSDTGIHGIALLANGTRVQYGETVAYGDILSFRVNASLASDAPRAGNLILTITVTAPDGNFTTLTSRKFANPGDGVTFDVGSVQASLVGHWTAMLSLTGDVPLGTAYTLSYPWSWEVSQPSGLELAPGSYLIQITISNLSTSGGQPVQAVFDTKVSISWSEIAGGYYQGWTSRNTIAAGGSKVNGYNWVIPAGWVGTSGSIEVSVLDPGGNELAKASLAFSVIG